MSYINKPSILAWNEANIRQAPETIGVYVLRNITQEIIYVGHTREPKRLRPRILEHFQLNDIPDVKYFSWYQTTDETNAQKLETTWIRRYKPIHNISLSTVAANRWCVKMRQIRKEISKQTVGITGTKLSEICKLMLFPDYYFLSSRRLIAMDKLLIREDGGTLTL